MKVKAIDFVISHVTDTRAAVRFYRDVLGVVQGFINDGGITGDGLTDTWTNSTPDGDPGACPVGRAGGSSGDRARGGGRGRGSGGTARKGVEIVMEPADSGSCRMAWIKDPWGNLLCIHRRNDGTCG